LGDKVNRFGNPFARAADSYFNYLNQPTDTHYTAQRFYYQVMVRNLQIEARSQQTYPDVFGKDKEGFNE